MISRAEKGEYIAELAKEFKIREETARDIMKQKDRIISFTDQIENPKLLSTKSTIKIRAFKNVNRKCINGFDKRIIRTACNWHNAPSKSTIC